MVSNPPPLQGGVRGGSELPCDSTPLLASPLGGEEPEERKMLFIRWTAKLIFDVLMFGIVNRSMALSFGILLLLAIGLVIAAAQVSAPFIYTLF